MLCVPFFNLYSILNSKYYFQYPRTCSCWVNLSNICELCIWSSKFIKISHLFSVNVKIDISWENQDMKWLIFIKFDDQIWSSQILLTLAQDKQVLEMSYCISSGIKMRSLLVKKNPVRLCNMGCWIGYTGHNWWFLHIIGF